MPTFIAAAAATIGAIRFLLETQSAIEILLDVLDALTDFIQRLGEIQVPQGDFPTKPRHLLNNSIAKIK